jgi:hypothetical protein
MSEESISITKTTGGLLSTLGLRHRKRLEVLRVTNNALFYHSTLGNIGEIKAESIDLIEFGSLEPTNVIKIRLKKDFDLKSKLSRFRQKLSELYVKKSGAEILIFPRDVDIDLWELSKLLKEKLNK